MPRVEVKLATPLRALAGGAGSFELEGPTVGAVLSNLVAAHEPLRSHLFTADGTLRNFVTVYLNEDDVRALDRDDTPVRDGDTVSIVASIAGGAGPAAGAERGPGAGPSESPLAAPLGAGQLERYSRHLLLPEVGVAGQRKLAESKVLLVGAGGLGAPAALYLVAAGVGEIGLVDFDRVELSNLQRQVLYATRDVGRSKLTASRERLESLNPEVRVNAHETRLSAENAFDVLRPYDVVVDGTDNFPTRYLVNDACVLLGKPNVYGSIYRFEGQASVFDARRGPCYRCLYPEPPPPELVPSCGEGGVLGVLPGLIGTLQAIETVKLLLGIGEPLLGRLVLFDALALRFRELRLRKNPGCVLCGPDATQTGLIDYAAFCAGPSSPSPADLPEVAPYDLSAELGRSPAPLLLDVREPEEWTIAHLPDAVLMPRATLSDRLRELDRAREIVVYCKTGRRSADAVRYLRSAGFERVRNLRGGIVAWANEVDPEMPRY